MSYILEALKKLEQKQQREGAPRLLSIPLDVPEEKKKSRVLQYVIAGALVLNAAAMTAWWIASRQYRKPVAVIETKSVQQTEGAGIAHTPPPAGGRVSAVDAPSSQRAAPPGAEKTMAIPKPDSQTLQTTSGERARVNPPASRAPEVQPRKEAKSVPPASGSKLLDLGELPPAVRNSLPEFKISGHAHSSEPRFRVARVNNKIVQEGEALSQGLKVDEIVPGGVIFTYQGYRFRVGINDNP